MGFFLRKTPSTNPESPLITAARKTKKFTPGSSSSGDKIDKKRFNSFLKKETSN